ncbi:oligosaccharide flippase family protein [Streptococcus parauberis]|uniref:Flippase Wzx n=1 Tax=Streptococcus parauberis TaxID=1348 RepID=A0A0S3TG48_9STRE|nr:oligosaccharide flippase family protein [Streptococcus parauberis]EMF49986.1 polysaccharide biosynthesis protein [Streptococcus parauberis KRS-02109]UWM86167.1 oligosaccharide flippase family protein [Streptococcus parauberis]UWM88138.1 oligosaccharide flippase family protein [Streptococcus parauberis]WEM58975.1 oligosaccharide flippase family protein [Streptococcus parauberis]BAU04062.1 flippase Wzx [Streptococcus parauberis]
MKFIRNLLAVLMSNAFTVFSGLLVGLVLPMILTIDDFGYFKTFTLYLTYLGLFSIGIIDGIVLKYGGNDFEDLQKENFRSYFRWYLIVHIIVSIPMLLLSTLESNTNIRFIIFALIINMISLNVIGYFRQISEITQRFKEYTIIKIAQSIFNILTVVGLFLLKSNGIAVNFKIYILLVIIANFIVTLWYVYLYQEIIFGKSTPLNDTFATVKKFSKIGIPLMFANLISTLILTLDRQFVNILFSNKIYAIYAFAFNLLSILTLATAAFSTVLYPSLKRSDVTKIGGKYKKFTFLSISIVFLLLSFYFPMKILIEAILPKYISSLVIFRVIFPTLPITTTITVIINNYFKTLGKSVIYFNRSIVILILSIGLNLLAYLIWKTPIAISASSVLTVLIWYVVVDNYLAKELKLNTSKNLIMILLFTIIFYSTSMIQNWLIGMIIYIVLFGVTLTIINPEVITYLKKTRGNKG